jgi:hypothetical protein
MGILIVLFLVLVMAAEHYSGVAGTFALLLVGFAHVGEEWLWPGGFPRWRAERLGRKAPSELRVVIEAGGLTALLVWLAVLAPRHPEAAAVLAGLLAADLFTHLPWGRVYSPGCITAFALFPWAIVALAPAVDSVSPGWALAGVGIIAASWLAARRGVRG